MESARDAITLLVYMIDLLNCDQVKLRAFNRKPAVGAYMRQIYRDLLYQDNTLVITTADEAVI